MTLHPAAVRTLFGVGAYACVSAVVYAGRGDYLAVLLLPIRPVVDALLPEGIALMTLELAADRGQELIALEVALVEPLQVGSRVVPAGETIDATTLAAYALQHPALIYAALVAWPCRSFAAHVVLLALGIPAVVGATLLDIPFVLAGLVHELLLDAGVTDVASRSVALYYECLHRGGRAALALAVAVGLGLAVGGYRPAQAAPVTTP
jgi:hypothetical protein